MGDQLRSELYKLRSRSVGGLLAALVVLVTVAALVHGLGLGVGRLSSRADQRGVLIDVGLTLGAVFAGLVGALSITTEFRTGTIRPALLVTPLRSRVIAAKGVTVLIAGFGVGALGAATAAGVGTAAIASRGLALQVSLGDYLSLVLGGAVAAALWAGIGLGVGAVVRAQIPTVVTVFAWLLFVENLFVDLPSAHRFLPGALAQTLAGQDRPGVLHAPAPAALLLAVYAAAAVAAGQIVTTRRDIG